MPEEVIEQDTVTVPEPEPMEEDQQEEGFTAQDLNALDPQERKDAIEQGLLTEDDIKNAPQAKEEDDEVEVDEDATDEEKQAVTKYNKNEKALYREMKQYRKRAQEAEEIAKRTGFVAAKAKANTAKLKEIQGLIDKIDNGEELTTKEMREVIGTVEDIPDASPQITEAQKQYAEVKAQTVELEGAKLFEDFEAISQMALGSLSDEDANRLVKYMNDPSVNARRVAEYIGDLARKNPNFTKGETDLTPARKAERNANRQRTSASINTGKSSRIVNVHDMTPEDLGRISQAEFERLDAKYPHVIKKILQKI